LIVKGNVNITGTIDVRGTSQDTSGRTTGAVYGGGGASGAGAIIILHGGTYSNSGTLNINGGTGFNVVDAGAGANGGAGASVVKQILTT